MKMDVSKMMPFTFLYFVYYASSQREQKTSPDEDRPTSTTSVLILAILMGPTVGLLALADRFTGWLAIWARLWVSMRLPVAGHAESGVAFMAVVVVLDIVIYRTLFGKKHYGWIHNKFTQYSASDLRLPLVLFSMVPLFLMFNVGFFAFDYPVRGSIILFLILVVVEMIFRIWWILAGQKG